MAFTKIEKKGKVGIITITREEALNALNKDVITDLWEAFKELEKDDAVHVIVITGIGKAFVAGADIAFMKDLTPTEPREFAMFGQSFMAYVERLEKPVIAAINGFALGGGCELAMCCDIRFANEKAKFGQPEVSLGITPGFGGTQRLSRLLGKGMAKKLIFSGEVIDSDEVLRTGLIEKIIPADDLLNEALSFAEKIANNSRPAIAFSKNSIENGYDTDLKTAIQIEADNFALCFTTSDQKEGMSAFLEKRKAEFK